MRPALVAAEKSISIVAGQSNENERAYQSRVYPLTGVSDCKKHNKSMGVDQRDSPHTEKRKE